jgi:hypothetical protein
VSSSRAAAVDARTLEGERVGSRGGPFLCNRTGAPFPDAPRVWEALEGMQARPISPPITHGIQPFMKGE